MIPMREALEASIAELMALLDSPDVREDDFQKWFERHPIVFDVLGYRRSIPHPELKLPSSERFIPDFIAQRPDGTWEIIELKRQDAAVLKNPERRTVFYSDMNTYVSQCIEYAMCCSDSYVAESLLESHGVVMNTCPESVLIAGRSDGLDRLKVHSLLARNTPKVKHYTYDDVLEELNQRYSNSLSGAVNGAGLSFYSCVSFLPMASQAAECLLDIGCSVNRSRIKLSRYGETLVTFSVVDDFGLRSLQDINIADHCDGVQFVCGVHVTHTSTSVLVLFEVNGRYVGEHKLAKGSLVLSHPVPMVVGADMTGGSFASVIIGSQLMRDPALSVIEREQLRAYLFDILWSPVGGNIKRQSYGLCFGEGRFMCTEGHPFLDAGVPCATNLVQRVDARKPILTNWPVLEQ